MALEMEVPPARHVVPGLPAFCQVVLFHEFEQIAEPCPGGGFDNARSLLFENLRVELGESLLRKLQPRMFKARRRHGNP